MAFGGRRTISTGAQHFEVAMSREQLASQGLTAGQNVRFTPSRIKVFERDDDNLTAGAGI
jgi:hypothetical protein